MERKKTMDNKAAEFATSIRGGYIVAQALHYAIQAMELVPMPYREVSNIDDMKYLKENIYAFPIQDELKVTEVDSITARMAKDKMDSNT